MNEGSGAETAEDREEALHASLVVVTKLDIVAKETHLTQARAGRNHLEATDETLFYPCKTIKNIHKLLGYNSFLVA